MRKLFKIIEKIVWTLVVIAIAIVTILVAIGIMREWDLVLNSINTLLPYLYIVAAVFILFKVTILAIQVYLETKIKEGNTHLQSIIDNNSKHQDMHGQQVTGKLDKLINDIANFKQDSTSKFVDYLNKNLHDTVILLAEQIANQRIEAERLKLEQAYFEKEEALNKRKLTIDEVLRKHDELESLQAEIAQKEQEKCELRLKKTEEYTMLVFSLAKTPVEDVDF